MGSGLPSDVRKRYINILQRFEIGGGMITSTLPQQDKNDVTELKLEGYLATYHEIAQCTLPNGHTVYGPALGITSKGREYLHQLREEETRVTIIPTNEKQRQDFLHSFPKAKNETTRYLLILHLASTVSSPREGIIFLPKEYPQFFWTHCRELEKEALLLGEPFDKMIQVSQGDNKSKIIEGPGYSLRGITYKGRLELARLERERREASWRHRLKEGLWTAFCFTAGSLVSAFIGWLFR